MDNDIELKHKDQDLALGQLDADFSVYNICSVGVGADAKGRIGEEINTTSLKMRMGIRWLPNAPLNTACHIRMILFWDSAPNGELPNIVSTGPDDQSVLDPASTAFESIFDQYNYNSTQQRFRIIYDKVWTLSSQFVAVNSDIELDDHPAPVMRYVKKTFKLGRKQIYQGNDPDYQALVTNGLYVGWYFYSPDSSDSEFNSLFIDANFRLYYKDC